jgi:hypothetical protein
MGGLVWVTVGLAIWHFTIFLPDRSWAGIIGAFVGATVGSFVFGLLITGFSVPSNDEMDLGTAAQGVPGALIGIAIVYAIGARQERREAEAHGGLKPQP